MISTWKIGDFSLSSFENRWVSWAELEPAAWPGGRVPEGDPREDLRAALQKPGIYVIARTDGGRKPKGAPHAAHHAIVYIGETSHLNRRLGQFGNSAGFFGARKNGHSAGWHWESEWPKETAFVALYPAPAGVSKAGLSPLWQLCREAQALATFAKAHRDHIPVLNTHGANNAISSE